MCNLLTQGKTNKPTQRNTNNFSVYLFLLFDKKCYTICIELVTIYRHILNFLAKEKSEHSVKILNKNFQFNLLYILYWMQAVSLST